MPFEISASFPHFASCTKLAMTMRFARGDCLCVERGCPTTSLDSFATAKDDEFWASQGITDPLHSRPMARPRIHLLPRAAVPSADPGQAI